ncbi:MAG: type II toxin-antitoxin system prevent-host-death family antitoxin [Erysipelotrichaceae bacterium]
MPNIKPISDLRNYSEVLSNVVSGEPLFLTKNGRGKYAVLEITDYEKMKATMKLISELSEGEQSAKVQGWKNLSDLQAILKEYDD